MKKTLATIALALVATGAMAQENGNRANGKIMRGPYETNAFFDNWYLGVAGGVNVYKGENDSYKGLGDRMAPALDVSLGKWITPSIGVRLQYSGLKSKGTTSYKSAYFDGKPDGKGMYDEKFNVMNLHTDFMWNISNALSGYKETRTWNFIPFIGFGWARSGANDQYNNSLATTLGLLNDIRLSNRLNLTLEGRYMIVDQAFDGVAYGCKHEAMVSVTAGLTVKLGKTNFKRVTKPIAPDYSSYNNRIKALEGDNSALTKTNKQLADELAAAKDRKADTVTLEGSVKATPVVLFFELGKATLDSKELTNLEFYVNNAVKLDKNKVFTLVGSADKETGTKAINQRLSEQRMQYVYDLLVNQYGISKDRLVKKAEGDTNNRFSEPKLNRAVVIE